MNAKTSYEETEKKGHQPVLAASIITYSRFRLIYSTAALYADNGIVVQFCSTIPAIHIDSF